MQLMRAVVVAVVAVVATAASACTIGEDTHEYVTVPAALKAQSRTCGAPFTAVDLSHAKACGAGKGHCWDGSLVLTTDLPSAECDGGLVCVPDAVLQANGSPLKACTFFVGGKPGVCMSRLVAPVEANANQLQKDVCDDSERCVPCVDPRDGSDTHACDPTGVHTAACVGGANQGAERLCCHGAGTCLREDAVPEDQRGDLSRETCGNAKLCAPRSLVSGKPVKCDTLGIAGGVCVDVCFASMLRSVQQVTRAGCGPSEVCVPCLVGKGQGLPGCD
jgi:hypothetical protein